MKPYLTHHCTKPISHKLSYLIGVYYSVQLKPAVGSLPAGKGGRSSLCRLPSQPWNGWLLVLEFCLEHFPSSLPVTWFLPEHLSSQVQPSIHQPLFFMKPHGMIVLVSLKNLLYVSLNCNFRWRHRCTLHCLPRSIVLRLIGFKLSA